MEYNLMLVISNTILLVGAGVVFILPLRKREKWWCWLPVGAVLCYLTMELGYRSYGMMIFVYYLITYLLIVLVANRSAELSLLGSCYCAVWIFITAIAVQEIWLVLRLSRTDFRVMDLKSIVELIVFSGVLFLILSKTVARWMPRGDIYQVSFAQVISAWLLGGMFVALSHVFMLPNLEKNMARMLIALCQICCVTLLFLHMESTKRRVAEKQLDILNLLCSFGAQQYTVGLKNVELVNRKCEELEGKIRQMEQYLPEEFRGEARSTIREAQVACDAVVKTGNDVLDMVLTEKKLLAENSKTQINCVANGKLLDFMEVVDIYALFAFGLDTALEDVEQIVDESHRLIDLLIYESQNFLVINMSHPLKSSAQLKNRNVLNNYKIMVIHRIVEKYHGMHSLERGDNFVTLKLLIPLAQNQK